MMDELREKTTIWLAACQRRVSSYYNERVHHRAFEESDLVLRKLAITNAFREEGKLQPNWEGSYRIQKMLGANTCVPQALQGETL